MTFLSGTNLYQAFANWWYGFFGNRVYNYDVLKMQILPPVFFVSCSPTLFEKVFFFLNDMFELLSE